MEDKNKPAKDAAPGTGRIDLAALSELMKLMGENDMVELEYECGDLALRLSKRAAVAPATIQTVAAPAAIAAPVAVAPAGAPTPAADSKKYLEITSPMVGTFYAASSPEAAPFATVGTNVHGETVVCLIEAMKVFNEIKAGVAGKIAKVLVKNEDPVEFGQVLFLVDPS